MSSALPSLAYGRPPCSTGLYVPSLVSILVPLYNEEEFVGALIDEFSPRHSAKA